MLIFLPLFVILFMHSNTYAFNINLETQEVIRQADNSRVIDKALLDAQNRFLSQRADMETITYDFTSGIYDSGPVAKIVSGFVTSSDIVGATDANNSFSREFLSADYENKFCIEVQFRDDGDVTPALRSKTVFFCALGLGLKPEPIDKTQIENSTNSINAMHGSINGFYCVNLDSCASGYSGSIKCNNEIAAGTISLGDSASSPTKLNVLNKTKSALNKCYVAS